MANPLILTEEEWMPRQAEFAQYDKAYCESCVSTTEPKSFTLRARKIILEGLANAARDGMRASEGAELTLPQSPVWGPTVKAESAISVYFKLVPQGTEEMHETTDGTASVKPPPLPQSGPTGGSDAYPANWERSRDEPSLGTSEGQGLVAAILAENGPKWKESERLRSIDALTKLHAMKLYRATELLEVTTEDVSAEMNSKKRKNAKPAIYIRGCVVEPKVRVEI